MSKINLLLFLSVAYIIILLSIAVALISINYIYQVIKLWKLRLLNVMTATGLSSHC